MKKENTAIRLKQIMSDRNLRQVDILNMTKPYCEKYEVKMNKSDISQYCSGKTEPNQDKLFVLGMALNVNEAWLMGYDVPMGRNDYEFKDTSGKSTITSNNIEVYKRAYDKSKFRSNRLMSAIIENAEKLDNDKKKSLLDYSYFLLGQTEQKSNISENQLDLQTNAANLRTDIDIPEGTDTSEDDIMDSEDF